MLRRRRKLLIAVVVVLILGSVGFAIWLRKKAPPDAVRMLPESEDGVFYLNLKPLRVAGVLKRPEGPREPEYEQFVKETGFEFERDLDHAAFAVHGPAAAGGQTRYSELLVGHFDVAKIEAYLKKAGKPAENYREAAIYTIPLEGRTLRVAILGVDQVAASNLESAAAIHEIIDHYRAAAQPREGPALVREHYHDVLLGSSAWFIGKIGAMQLGKAPSGGLELPLIGTMFGGSVVVASVRYQGSVHLKMEAFTTGPEQAQNINNNLQNVAGLLKSAELTSSGGGPDPDVKAFFDSINVAQKDERVVMTATIPQGFIKKVLTEPPTEQVVAPSPTPSPTPTPKPRRKR